MAYKNNKIIIRGNKMKNTAEEITAERIKNFMDALVDNRYSVSFFHTKEDAAAYLEKSIRGKTVGFGDSGTLNDMGMHERLSAHNEIHSPMLATAAGSADFLLRAANALNTQVFLTSVNAAAETGELVNIDGTGNRVAGSLFNHEKVYFVFGINKIAPTLEKAIWRARNIAAPRNAKRLGKKTPCAVKGDKCYDCKSPARICNDLSIHLKKMNNMEMEVVLIGETLGL